MVERDKLFGDLSEAEIKKLSPEEFSVWAIRPRREEIERVVFAMKLRVIILVIVLIYVVTSYGDRGVYLVFVMFLFMYELAYYNLSKEKAERKYSDALLWHQERIDGLASNAGERRS